MSAPTRVSAAASAFGSSTSPKTVSSIAVQAGDLLVVRAVNENASETFNTPTSTGLTFSAGPNVGSTGSTGRAAVWYADIASSGTISVSLTTAGSTGNWFGIVVSVWRNHGGVGATASVNNTAGTGAPTFNITTTAANSGIDWCTSDFNAIDGASRTYRVVNGAAATEDNYFRDSVHYAAYAAYHPDAGTAGTVAVGESAPAGQKYAGVAVEILAGSGGSTPVSATRALTYDLIAPVSATRALSYSIAAQVAATRALSYSISKSVSATRALSYAILAPVAATRALAYAILMQVAATRGLSYDILNAATHVSATRALTYDLIAPTAATRALTYSIAAQVAATRALKYDIVKSVAATRALNYNLIAPVSTTRRLTYNIGVVTVHGDLMLLWLM